MLSSILDQIPTLLLVLPAVLLSLSIHEAAHGLAANQLGDPTAKNMGRITLNPLKHLDPIGFIGMLFFRIGWANPVPVNTRYFKKPRRDMALTAAAGPLSNLLLAIIFASLLRLVMIPLEPTIQEYYMTADESILENGMFTFFSIIATMLYLGIGLNINLMLFNLIPLPPLDGSRIAYIFLPTNLYFKIMQYERYIMIGFIIIFATGILDVPLSFANSIVTGILYSVLDMPIFDVFIAMGHVLSKLPTFSL